MLRVVLFVVAGCIIIAAAWLLAGIPGHLIASFGAYTIETSAPFAILTLVVLVLAILLMLRILGGLMGIPRSTAGWTRRRRRVSGERAVTRVLIALAAGEPGTARKE